MFTFGSRSLEELGTCHPDLRIIADEALIVSPIDWGISDGGRTFDEQLKYFLKGASTLDPRIPEKRKKANHLKTPSMAFDFYAYVPGKRELAYDLSHLCLIAGVIISTANRLYAEGKISHLVRWGGNWDRDGEILTDQSFDDSPHIELYKPKAG